MKCTIIGSFRKYWRDILKAYDVFERNGITVLSPSNSDIVNPRAKFVRLATDRKSAPPAEIELRVLIALKRSDFVYLVDPRGYVGRTTAYEIGHAYPKEIYSSRHVRHDYLRLWVTGTYSPQDLCNFLKSRQDSPRGHMSF